MTEPLSPPDHGHAPVHASHRRPLARLRAWVQQHLLRTPARRITTAVVAVVLVAGFVQVTFGAYSRYFSACTGPDGRHAPCQQVPPIEVQWGSGGGGRSCADHPEDRDCNPGLMSECPPGTIYAGSGLGCVGVSGGSGQGSSCPSVCLYGCEIGSSTCADRPMCPLYCENGCIEGTLTCLGTECPATCGAGKICGEFTGYVCKTPDCSNLAWSGIDACDNRNVSCLVNPSVCGLGQSCGADGKCTFSSGLICTPSCGAGTTCVAGECVSEAAQCAVCGAGQYCGDETNYTCRTPDCQDPALRGTAICGGSEESQVTCLDNPSICPATHQCNNGHCVERDDAGGGAVTCTQDPSICPATHQCNNGHCVERDDDAGRCSYNSQCGPPGSGRICSDSGRCVDGDVGGSCNGVTGSRDCGPGQVCDGSFHCIRECSYNSQCGAGRICTSGGACVDGTSGGTCNGVTGSRDCRPGQVCDGSFQCVNACGNGVCDSGESSSTCLADCRECSYNSQCGAGRICTSGGRCVGGFSGGMCNGVSGSDDCKDGQICDGSFHCVTPPSQAGNPGLGGEEDPSSVPPSSAPSSVPSPAPSSPSPTPAPQTYHTTLTDCTEQPRVDGTISCVAHVDGTGSMIGKLVQLRGIQDGGLKWLSNPVSCTDRTCDVGTPESQTLASADVSSGELRLFGFVVNDDATRTDVPGQKYEEHSVTVATIPQGQSGDADDGSPPPPQEKPLRLELAIPLQDRLPGAAPLQLRVRVSGGPIGAPIERELTLGSDGRAEVDLPSVTVADGTTIRVSVKTRLHLGRTLEGTTAAGVLRLEFEPLLAGDVEGATGDEFRDGVINSFDVARMRNGIEQYPTSRFLDLDGSGYVGAEDLSLLLANLNSTSDPE